MKSVLQATIVLLCQNHQGQPTTRLTTSMRCDWRGSEKLGIDYADVKNIYKDNLL